MDEQRAEYLTKLKHVKLAQAGVSISDVERYAQYVTAEDEAEIEQQAQTIAEDVVKDKDKQTNRTTNNGVWKPFD